MNGYATRRLTGTAMGQYALLLLALAGMIYYWGWVFDFGYKFDWSVLYAENKTYGETFGLSLLRGLELTVKITLVSSAVALTLGVVFGLGRLSAFRPFRAVSTFYVEFFRNTPLLVQLFFWYFALPKALPDAAREWLFTNNYEFLTAVTGLSIYTGSFMAEVIRAGLQSIPKGILEAAYSSGLNYFQALTRIILPMAFRAIIPPLGSEFLNNMKNSTLAMVVGVQELCWASQQVESLTFRGFEATTAATLIYLSLSLTISAILNLLNVKLAIPTTGRKSAQRQFAEFLFYPVGLVLGLLGWVPRLHRRWLRRKQARSLRLSPLAVAVMRVRNAAFKTISLAVKTGFVLLLAGLLWQIAAGVVGLNWKVIADNVRTLLIWRFPNGDPTELFHGLGGLALSVAMAVIAITVSFFIGLLVGLGRMSENRAIRTPCLLYIEIIRGTPLIMVIFWVYFFSPIFFKMRPDVFWSATLAMTLFTGAYLAEIVRGGIQNIPRGQFEAAQSCGLSYFQTMRRVILPQALKQMIPAIVGQFISIFKDTSLAYVIGVLELTFVAQGLNNRLMIYPFEVYGTVAFLYFICCYAMSLVARRLERRLSPERIRLAM